MAVLHIRDVTKTANSAILRVHALLNETGLESAHQKTKAVLISSKNLREDGGYCDTEILPADMLKYLGIIFDTRLAFNPDIDYAVGKAEKVAAGLSNLMLKFRSCT